MQSSKAQEELSALQAIYSDDVCVQTTSSGSTNISIHINEDYAVCAPSTSSLAVVDFYLTPEYPSTPPTYQVQCGYLNAEQRRTLDASLQALYLNHVGDQILYEWLETIKEALQQTTRSNEDNQGFKSVVEEKREDAQTINVKDEAPIQISTGDPFEDRKSIFQAHVAEVHSREEAMQVLRQLLCNSKIARATHNIYAYRIVDKQFISDCEDDGEHGAGAKLAHLLEMVNAQNVMVVVTRWYGGIHLGPDRFRIINEVARRQLVANGFDKRVNEKEQGKNAKKKGKR